MKTFEGATISWSAADGVVELALHKTPCNEIGSQTLDELEKFVDALDSVLTAHALIVHSTVPAGFSAGADLRRHGRRRARRDRAGHGRLGQGFFLSS